MEGFVLYSDDHFESHLPGTGCTHMFVCIYEGVTVEMEVETFQKCIGTQKRFFSGGTDTCMFVCVCEGVTMEMEVETFHIHTYIHTYIHTGIRTYMYTDPMHKCLETQT